MKRMRIIFFTLGLLLLTCSTVWSDSDIEVIKARILENLMDNNINNSEIEHLITSFNDSVWPGINYEDVSREGFEHRFHLDNMVVLAEAYKTKTSDFYKNKQVKRIIEAALKHWVEQDYTCENWWYNQIGTPHNLVTLMLIMGNELPDELVEKAQPIIRRAHVDAPGARPGGDRIKIAGIQAKNLIFNKKKTKFGEIIDVIEGEIKHVHWIGMDYGYGYGHNAAGFTNRAPAGRGIQYDNSFHHRWDGVNNTLSYGIGYAGAFIEWAAYTADTKYAFSEEKLMELVDYYLDGICKSAVFGKYPDAGIKNRSFSRKGILHAYNSSMPETILKTTDYRKKELQEIVDIREKGIKPTISYATFYWHSEHFTCQRPEWFTSVRMYSTRNHNMEKPYNSEGLLNHHRGDGTNHISRTGDEYFDIAPVFDYQKIPGATIMQKTEMPPPDEIQKLGETKFVGAVTDGKYGAVSFDFKSPHDPLIARKSWFFFDDEYVCLGSGISCRSDSTVVTTLNQCLLRDAVIVSGENGQFTISNGEQAHENVDWVYHDGIGYVFPGAATVNIKNDKVSGSWQRINKQSDSPKQKITEDVFKIWIDHGKKVSEETYEYIVVPATSPEKMQNSTSGKNIKIISNTPEIQAVKNSELGILQAVFYDAGEILISENLILSSDNPGILMLKLNAENITEISVADPARELKKFHFSVSSRLNASGSNFRTYYDSDTKTTSVTIDLPQEDYSGDSITIQL